MNYDVYYNCSYCSLYSILTLLIVVASSRTWSGDSKISRHLAPGPPPAKSGPGTGEWRTKDQETRRNQTSAGEWRALDEGEKTASRF